MQCKAVDRAKTIVQSFRSNRPARFYDNMLQTIHLVTSKTGFLEDNLTDSFIKVSKNDFSFDIVVS